MYRASMATAVVNNVDLPITMTREHDGKPSNSSVDVISGFRHQAIVSYIDPCFPEDLLHFEFEYFFIEVERAMNMIVMNQRLNLL